LLSFDSLPIEQVEKIVWVFKERMLDLRKDTRLKYILIFKNKGKRAGASLEHPHCQLIATPVLPDVIKLELDQALKYYQYKERCIYCDIVSQESEDKVRIIDENEKFIAFTPFASVTPFEIMILPKEHISGLCADKNCRYYQTFSHSSEFLKNVEQSNYKRTI